MVRQDSKTIIREVKEAVPLMKMGGDGTRTTRAWLEAAPDTTDKPATDIEALGTDFGKVILGNYEELRENADQMASVSDDFNQQDQDCVSTMQNINAMVFYGTKYFLSVLFTILLGPILAFVWGVVMACLKFAMSWIIYPIIKVSEILCKPMRRLVKTCFMPVEPLYELFAHCWPHVGFSLFSTGDDAGVNHAGWKNGNSDDTYDEEKVLTPVKAPAKPSNPSSSRRVLYGGGP